MKKIPKKQKLKSRRTEFSLKQEAKEHIKKLRTAGVSSDRIISIFVNSENIKHMIDRAGAGDTHAAKEVIFLAARLLHSSNQDTSIPQELRAYLSYALFKIYGGESADKALHLKRSGRPNYPYRLKKEVGHYIAQKIAKEGCSVEAAAVDAEEHVRENIEFFQRRGLDRPVDSKTLEGMFYEVKDELEIIYSAVREDGS